MRLWSAAVGGSYRSRPTAGSSRADSLSTADTSITRVQSALSMAGLQLSTRPLRERPSGQQALCFGVRKAMHGSGLEPVAHDVGHGEHVGSAAFDHE